MKVVSYTISELPDLLEQEQFQGEGEIPISPLRAQAYFHNPRAEKADRVLWCIFDKEQLIAYRLILPNKIFLGEIVLKMAWYSCLWVHSDHRGKGYGKKLTNLALEVWDNKIAFVNAAPASLSLYTNIDGCRVLYENKGMRYYFTSELATILPLKKPALRNFTFLLRPIDGLINAFAKITSSTSKQKITYQVINKLSKQDDLFIRNMSAENISKRAGAEFDWLVDYPWVVESSVENTYVNRYHFSIQYPVYQNYFIKIEVDGKPTGIVFLKNKECHFSVHYVWAEVGSLEAVAGAIMDIIQDKNPKTLSVFHDGLVAAIHRVGLRCLFKRNTKQVFLAYEGIPDIEGGAFQYGDGDTMFT